MTTHLNARMPGGVRRNNEAKKVEEVVMVRHKIGRLGVAIAIGAAAFVQLTASGQAATNETYKIGVSEPLSGAASSLGIPVVDSVKLAVEAINAAGGVDGHRIELLVRDDQSRPDIAVQNFRQLIGDGVLGIIGPNQGSNALAVAPAVNDAKMPMCAFSNTISITHVGNPYIFRCQTSDTDNVKAALLFAKDKLHASKIGVVYTSDAYGTEAFAAMTEAVKSMSLPIVVSMKIDYGATDTTAEWTKVLAAKPDAILLWGSGSVMSVTLRNARQLGSTLPIIAAQGVAAAAIIKGAGAAAEGMYAITLTAPDKVPPAQEELAKLYKKKNGDDYQLTIYDTIGWDAVHIYAQAIHNAGGRKDKMLEGMEQIHNYAGAAGTYTYGSGNHDGLGVDSVWIVQVKDGRMFGVQRGL